MNLCESVAKTLFCVSHMRVLRPPIGDGYEREIISHALALKIAMGMDID